MILKTYTFGIITNIFKFDKMSISFDMAMLYDMARHVA